MQIDNKQTVEDINNYIKTHGIEPEPLKDLLGLFTLEYREKVFDREYWLKVSNYVKQVAYSKVMSCDDRYVDIYEESYLVEAPILFESYLWYMEKDRAKSKQFYLPRRETLHDVVLDLQDLEDDVLKTYGLSLPPRVGKALAYDTPVLTKNGWKKHGDLTIRDEVIGLDGKFHKILAIHNPCEMEYKVTFTDGEEIYCHGNHEWHIYNRHRNRYDTLETKQMIDGIESGEPNERGHRYHYQMPIIDVVEGEHKELAVDPYTLGAWLGDGRNTNPDICGAESDYAIIEHILDSYELAWKTKHATTGVMYYGFRGLREALQAYGMCHSRRRVEKHIPDVYLTASIDQRLELLAGLLDTDGTLRRSEHRYAFTTNEEQLRDDFVALVNTFGWRTCVTKNEESVSSSGIKANKPYWAISFNPTMYIPCRLKRKQLNEYSKQRKIAIKSIEPCEKGIMGNCITVEGGLYLAGNTLKPTHNSTICIFFLSWIMGRKPNSHNAMGGHSGLLAKGFYKETLNLLTSAEYNYGRIFPHIKIESKSAEDLTINLNKPDRFPTLTCRGIEGTWTGAVDISYDGYLYVDDLIRDREESLSPIRLENRYQDFQNVMVDRMQDGAKMLLVGTRWNLADPIGREEARLQHKDNSRFRKIPALNDNDESNFNYSHNVGFSTEYYKEMRARLDANEWMAKYQQKPFVREGLLLPADELNYFNGVLPDEEHYIACACDVAWGGSDSTSMPIGAVFSDRVYIIGWVFNNGDKYVTRPKVADAILEYKPQKVAIEGNNGGTEYAEDIDTMIREKGFKTNIQTPKASTRISKEAKIIQYASDIKREFYFLSPDKQPLEYKKAMEEVTMYTQLGKNPFDDGIDSLVQLYQLIDDSRVARVEAYSFRI